MDFSITVRPTAGISQTDVDLYLDWLRKSPVSLVVVSLEKADSARHIQSAVRFTKKKRPDSLLRTLRSLFGLDPNSDEWKYAIKVRLHNDFPGLIGYCLKECQPPIFTYGITQVELDAAQNYYSTIITSKRKSSISRSTFFDVYRDLYGPVTHTTDDVIRHTQAMLLDGYKIWWFSDHWLVSLAPALVNYCGTPCKLIPYTS